MITSTIIKGFGPVRNFQWNGTGRINLVIGPNKSKGSGDGSLIRCLLAPLMWRNPVQSYS